MGHYTVILKFYHNNKLLYEKSVAGNNFDHALFSSDKVRIDYKEYGWLVVDIRIDMDEEKVYYILLSNGGD